MNLCFSLNNGFTSPRFQTQKTCFSSQFINHIQVNSFSSSFPSFPLHSYQVSSKFSTQRINFVTASRTDAALESAAQSSFRSKNPKDINILVVGSTGYIGKFVVEELVDRGFNVIAVARERSGIKGKNSKDETLNMLQRANVCFSDVTNLDSLEKSLDDFGVSIDVVVSCLASRSGGIKDSWLIDYEATKNSLVAGRNFGAKHFVLLSAICVQKPLLEFQRAKLKFEDELMKAADENDGFTYSIARPTAFFKSLGGQVELVKDGKPYVMFGDGKLCACKPISEQDLASFIADCVLSEDKINQVLPIGGPGKALTPLEQGEMLYRLLGKEPKFLKVPIGIMDFAIGVLDFLVKIFPSMEDAAEFGKIGRYYAAESMLILDPETGEYSAEKTPSYGKDTLEDFFERVLREGMAGQELGLVSYQERKENKGDRTKSVQDKDLSFLDNTTMIVGGTDTSAITIEWAMSNLLNHPKSLKRLQDELNDQIGYERLIDESDLPKLPFLQNVISETLRLYPPTPLLINPRLLSSDWSKT